MPVDQGVEPTGALVVTGAGAQCPAGKVGVAGAAGLGLGAVYRLRGIGGRLGATRCSSAAGGRGHSGGGRGDAGGTVEHAQSSSIKAGAALRGQGDLFMEFAS